MQLKILLENSEVALAVYSLETSSFLSDFLQSPNFSQMGMPQFHWIWAVKLIAQKKSLCIFSIICLSDQLTECYSKNKVILTYLKSQHSLRYRQNHGQ